MACFANWIRSRITNLLIFFVPDPRLDGLKSEDSVVELVTLCARGRTLPFCAHKQQLVLDLAVLRGTEVHKKY